MNEFTFCFFFLRAPGFSFVNGIWGTPTYDIFSTRIQVIVIPHVTTYGAYLTQ